VKRNLWFGALAVLIALLLCALASWLLGSRDQWWVWGARILLPVICIDLAWALHKYHPRLAERIADPLRDIVGGYYEKDGMCFSPQFKPNIGICWVHLYVQNRYERAGSVRISLTVPGRNTDDLDVFEEIECKGGSLVVRRIPYAVPPGAAGHMIYFRVAASSHYPKGRGRLLRHREGTRVAGTNETNLMPYGCTFAVLLALVGRVAWGRAEPTIVGIRLPAGAAQVPDDIPGEQELLWEPSLPTGGFFVLPPKEEQRPADSSSGL
jgi:hypothetical protein